MSKNAIGRRGISWLALAALVMVTIGAESARAGTWVQVSCVNPGGSAAPAEGWTHSSAGPTDPWGLTNTQCSPGTPMFAELADLSAAPPSSVEYLSYQPPDGSTLFGGAVDVNLSADGYGNDATGHPAAAAFAQLYEPSTSTAFFQCVAFFQTCGPSPDFSGVVNLPSDAQGQLIAGAGCASGAGTSCNQNAKNNAWALVQIVWAHLLLTSSESPTGSGFSGSALQGSVRGAAHVVFDASEPTGPGIYDVSVAIDGQTVSAGTPSLNGGKCVPVGTDPTGALMFDYQQPCLTSEVVDASVPTAGLPDGTHELAITVTDAAHNSSTVLDQTITTSNPQTTPNPRGRNVVRARFVISWTWSGATTLLRSIRVQRLPRRARVSVRCAGRSCPRLKAAATGSRRVSALLRRLGGRRLTAGQTLLITVTAPHRRAERIALTIRSGRKPAARLLKR